MITAKDLMTKNVITVTTGTPVKDVVKIMFDNEIEAIPVIDGEDKLAGIITDGDLVLKFSKFYPPLFKQLLDEAVNLENPKFMETEVKKILGDTAGDIMTTRVICVTEDTSLDEIATIIVSRKIKRIPVIKKDKKLIGVISRRDIITVLSKDNSQEM